MNNLLTQQRIQIETKGPPSKERSRLVIADGEPSWAQSEGDDE